LGKVLGIDLGTTNSCMAIMEGGQPQVIQNREGGRVTPSVVAYSGSGERLVGALAKRQAAANPRRTISSVKRLMGNRPGEASEEISNLSYPVISVSENLLGIPIEDKTYTPQEVSAAVLQFLRISAEEYLGQKITDAVITVPAHFHDGQRQATIEAGKIAGLNVRRILNEPTAAALAYGLKDRRDGRIAVYDLGGGTFDIAILEIKNGSFYVKAVCGDTMLGGNDFDRVIAKWLWNQLLEAAPDADRDDYALKGRMLESAEKAKCELSHTLETAIMMPFIQTISGQARHLEGTLDRRTVEKLTMPLIERTLKPCRQALADANLDVSQIDEVILVGGQSRMPKIREVVSEFFGRELCKGVNPEEVVALGAAIQAGFITGELTNSALQDVTPLSLGVETAGDGFAVLIERNSPIPIRRREIFTTAEDEQEAVSVHVMQGERGLASENRSLGKFDLLGIGTTKKGEAEIEVTFEIDEDGVVNVSAIDLATRKNKAMTIKGTGYIGDDDICRMIDDAQSHELADNQKRELTFLKHQAEDLFDRVELIMTGQNLHEDKIKHSHKLNEKMNKLKDALNSDNVTAIEKMLEQFMAAAQPLLEKKAPN
jgi:molecular chaperone DnaK